MEKKELKNSKKKVKVTEVKETTKKHNNINIDKLKNVVIIVLSLIIVFGLAFVVPELKNCGTCSNNKKAELDAMHRELNSSAVSAAAEEYGGAK